MDRKLWESRRESEIEAPGIRRRLTLAVRNGRGLSCGGLGWPEDDVRDHIWFAGAIQSRWRSRWPLTSADRDKATENGYAA